MELQWKDLNTVIDRSLADGKLRLDQLHTYEKLRDQVLEWLTKNENKLDSLEPVAVDADILKKQTDEMKVRPVRFTQLNYIHIPCDRQLIFGLISLQPIMKEYRDYESTIGRVADLGAAYENIGRLESPRKPSLSPGKRPSITTCKLHPLSLLYNNYHQHRYFLLLFLTIFTLCSYYWSVMSQMTHFFVELWYFQTQQFMEVKTVLERFVTFSKMWLTDEAVQYNTTNGS